MSVLHKNSLWSDLSFEDLFLLLLYKKDHLEINELFNKIFLIYNKFSKYFDFKELYFIKYCNTIYNRKIENWLEILLLLTYIDIINKNSKELITITTTGEKYILQKLKNSKSIEILEDVNTINKFSNYGLLNHLKRSYEKYLYINYKGLIQMNLIDINLNSLNLSKINLSNSKLENANFSNAYLAEANFSHADLTHADFSNSKLENANFSNAYLAEANFSHADLKGANFSDANLACANFANTIYLHANFSG